MISIKQHIELMSYIERECSPEEYVDSLKPIEKLDFIRSSVETYPVQDHTKHPTSILNSKKVFYRIDELVLGQFIMLEQIITGKTKLADHKIDLEIAKLIIRPKNHKIFDNESLEDEKNNQEDILSYDVREVYYILNKFIKSREQTLFTEFSGVFYDKPDTDIEADDEEETEEKNSDMVFSQQWYWYSIVRMLANEDITKYNEIYMLPMSIVLPEMSYLAQKSKIESAKQRQEQAMRKL
tara:strand:- start:593 stop:1309 length:717 start_codon:yes stop_codon:yes gene_type:complete